MSPRAAKKASGAGVPAGPKMVLQVVTWNQRKFLPVFLASLREQDFKDFTLVLMDNDSKDDTRSFLSEYDFAGIGAGVEVMRNFSNRGFGAAHSQLLAIKRSEWVGLLNADLVLPPDFLSKMFRACEAQPGAWLHGPRLQRCSWAADAPALELGHVADLPPVVSVEFSTVVDSLGLKPEYSGIVADRAAGQDWLSLKDKVKPGAAFGVSGACVFFKREDFPKFALETAEGKRELFDPRFFAYQEDIDLAWRVQERGGISFCHTDVVAYHFRNQKGTRGFFRRAWQWLRPRRKDIARHSYENHLRVLAAHMPFFKFFPLSAIAALYECRGFLRILLGHWYVVASWGSLLRDSVPLWKARGAARRQKNFGLKEYLRWCRQRP